MHDSPTGVRPLISSSPPLIALKTSGGQRTLRGVALLRTATVAFSALVAGSAGWALAEAFDGGSPAEAPGYLWWLLCIGAAGAAACARAEILVGVRGAREAEKDVRGRLLHSFFSTHLRSASSSSPGRAVSLMTDAVERTADYRQIYLGSTLAALICPLLILLYIGALDWVSGLSIFAAVPLVPAALWVFFRFFRGVSARSRARREALTVSYLDSIRQLTLIRLYGAGERTENTLRERGEENRRAVMRLLAGNQLVIVVMDSVFLLFLICWSTLVISWRTTTGALTTGGALSALLLLPLLLEPLTQVAGFFYIGMGGRASQRAIARALAADNTTPTSPPRGTDTGTPSPDSAVSVRGLSHDFGRGTVLNRLSFDIPRGSKTALLGESGTGKSTLLSLIHGTLQIQDGAVAVNGTNLADIAPSRVPLESALLSQQSRLFAGSIADNLRFARDSASEQQMWDALRQARVADEVRALPAGLNTVVGEEGLGLSGGQIQRISLARALLTGRNLLLLDEPTSQVDAESEQKILEALGALGPDTTLVMVTHRPALLEIADTVLFLDRRGLHRVKTTGSAGKPAHTAGKGSQW